MAKLQNPPSDAPAVIDLLVDRSHQTSVVIVRVLEMIDSERLKIRDVRRLQVAASMIAAAKRELEFATCAATPSALESIRRFLF